MLLSSSDGVARINRQIDAKRPSGFTERAFDLMIRTILADPASREAHLVEPEQRHRAKDRCGDSWSTTWRKPRLPPCDGRTAIRIRRSPALSYTRGRCRDRLPPRTITGPSGDQETGAAVCVPHSLGANDYAGRRCS